MGGKRLKPATASSHRARTRDRTCKRIWTLLAEGKTDEQVQELLGLHPGDAWKRLRIRALELQAQNIRESTPEEIFLEYSLVQLQCLAEAESAIASLKTNDKGSTAYVAAIRAKSEFYDKIMKFGQDLGLIHKRVEEKKVIHGVLFAQMSDDDLRQAIAEQALRLQAMVKQFGGVNILDMNPTDLHYVLPSASTGPVEEMVRPKSKTQRANTQRIHGGRRVVKEKLQ